MDDRIDVLHRRAAADPAAITLAGGLPSPALFPRVALAAAAGRSLRREGDRALQYGWPEGREGLRRWVADQLRARGAAVSPDEVIITNGAQQAVAVAAQLLVREGDAVAVDPESYPGALDAFRGAGARLVAPGADGARLAYTMPALSNPRGRRTDARARRALLAWAAQHDAHLIEDDAYAALGFAHEPGRALLADDRARVWHVGTFSKTLCPGLRVGWLVPPPAWGAEARERKRVGDLQANGLTQAMLEEFLARDDFAARLARARRYYARHARALLAALRRHLPEWRFEEPEGGFSVWAWAPEPGDDAELLACAVHLGVSFDPGSLFRARPAVAGDEPLAVRLSFSCEALDRLEPGVRRFARAWQQYRRRRRAPTVAARCA